MKQNNQSVTRRMILVKYKSSNHKDEPDNPKKYHRIEIEVPEICHEIKSVEYVVISENIESVPLMTERRNRNAE